MQSEYPRKNCTTLHLQIDSVKRDLWYRDAKISKGYIH